MSQPISFPPASPDAAEPYAVAYRLAYDTLREIHAAAQRDLGLGENFMEFARELYWRAEDEQPPVD